MGHPTFYLSVFPHQDTVVHVHTPAHELDLHAIHLPECLREGHEPACHVRQPLRRKVCGS